jgi:hypothetical protein
MNHFCSTVSSDDPTGKNGMYAHIRGWNCGVRIEAKHNILTGKDEFEIYRTSGNNGGKQDELIKVIKER